MLRPAFMAPYSVRAPQTREDMHAIVEVTYQAHTEPYFTGIAMLCPIFGYYLEDRAQSIAASKERVRSEELQNDGSKHWLVVEDNSTHEIVAGVAWQYFETSPFPDGKPKLDFHWWPPGDAKDCVEEMFQQMMVPRSLWMQRLHGEITNMVVHPNHRKQGIGLLMMEAISNALDEHGLEGFTDAIKLGRLLYEKAGFRALMKIDFFMPLAAGIIEINYKIR